MPEFPLEPLGPIAFQELAEALLIQACGILITPMGVGRDGGRDLKTTDTVRIEDGADPLEIEDYTVFQVKHLATLGSHSENASWLWGAIRKELKQWMDSPERSMIPKTLVFVTNVPLTPFPGSGGRDTIEQLIRDYRAQVDKSVTSATDSNSRRYRNRQRRFAQIESIRVLDRRWVTGALAGSDAVRKAFPQMLTAADVFAGIADFTGTLPVASMTEALREHARQSLSIDGAVWMAEGGDSKGRKVALHDLVVDLPVLVRHEIQQERDSIVDFVVDRAEKMLRPKFTAGDDRRHVVITGAAGNGKTTTAKFIVQVFRCAMLRGATLSQGQQKLVDGTVQALSAMGRELPAHLRWPVRIDLKDLLQKNQLLDGATMLSAITARVNAELDAGHLSAAKMTTWQREWPWLVVFDGFDEITDPNSRRTIIERIEQFIEEGEAANADLMVVLTTRSLGYNDEMSDKLFKRIDLDYLKPEEALAYADRVVGAMLSGDRKRQKQVMTAIKSAAKNPAQSGLLRTPLQILILTIIVDGSQYLDPDRYGLFSRYFDLAFDREKSKGTRLQTVLTNFEPVIRALHRRIGFVLHARAEAPDTPDPVLTERELRDLIWQELDAQGHKPAITNDPRVQSVLETATHRLVLLGPRGDGYGFDIRSLQELTAGQWLMEDDPRIAANRLRTAAASPHWRNAVLFATGYAFHGGNSALHREVLAIFGTLDVDKSARLGNIFPVAPRLALEMIDDGMVRNRPGFRDTLFEIALGTLFAPPEIQYAPLLEMLIRIADADVNERNALAAALRLAMSGTLTTRRNATLMRSLIDYRDRNKFTATRQMIVAVVPASLDKSRAGSATAWVNFNNETKHVPLHEPLARAVLTIRKVSEDRADSFDSSAILQALSDPAIAPRLERALEHLLHTDERVLQELRKVWAEATRRPIGTELEATTAD